MDKVKDLYSVTLKHVVGESGPHWIEKTTETATSLKTVHSEEIPADQIAIVFMGNHILAGLTEVYSDRYPTLPADQVHVFRYGGSYKEGEKVPDSDDKVAMVLEQLRNLEPSDISRLADELNSSKDVKYNLLTSYLT